MGNSLSGFLAGIYMIRFEEQFFGCSRNKPVFYIRYVDDYFMVFNGNKWNADNFLNYINGRVEKIKFTMEKENINVIEYMDVRIFKNIDRDCNINIETSVFRKKTFFGLSNNWFLDIDNHSKINVNNKILRAIKLCSNSNLFRKEIDMIKRECFMNDYPRSVIENLFSKKNIDSIKNRVGLGTDRIKDKIIYIGFNVSKNLLELENYLK